MPRSVDNKHFESVYQRWVVSGSFQEPGDYYPRYMRRYREVIRRAAQSLPEQPVRVLEVGGGQHALLSAKIWGDTAAVADLPGPHHNYLRQAGLEVTEWNLRDSCLPFEQPFDLIFLCEVIAHIPEPPYQYLARLKSMLRPGGILVLTTPNLFRVRNLVFMLRGKNFWGPFADPEPNAWDGAFIDYSAEHLAYQLKRAGFESISVEHKEFGHAPGSIGQRVASWILRPATWIPRYRYNLVAVAKV